MIKRLLAVIIFFTLASSSYAANHFFTGLPVDSNGWTDFETITSSGYGTARVLFVSSASGNDTNAANNITSNGHYGVADLTFNSNGFFLPPAGVVPFATVATAYAYCRVGSPDILLLERGSVWVAGLGAVAKSGASQTTPHIIASYGDTGDRPRIDNTAFICNNADYLVISGIHFYSADWTTAGRAIDSRVDSSYQTFEDLYIQQKAGDIIQGQSGLFATNIAFRRCIWHHSNAHDGQLYIQQADGVLIEECTFIEPYDDDYPAMTRLGRFFYFTSEGTSGPSYHDYLNNVIMRGNIFYNGERDAVDLRSGGDFKHNLVVASNTNYFGGRGGSQNTIQSVDVSYNAFLQGTSNVTGYNNVFLINIDGGVVSENIFSDNTNIGPYGHVIYMAGDGVFLDIARNIDISSNILYGRSSEYNLTTSSALTDVQNVTISDNDFQLVNGRTIINNRTWGGGLYRFEGFTYSGNRYYSTASASSWFTQGGSYAGWVAASGETGSSSGLASYSDPSRTVGSYNLSLGGTATTTAFMAAVLGQSRQSWNANLKAVAAINYVRAGFDKTATAYAYDTASSQCDVSHPYLCTTTELCAGAGLYWYDDECHATAQGAMTCYLDADTDGYSPGNSESVETCSANYYTAAQLAATSGDCNDSNAAIHPGATDICGNGIDEDCSGADAVCAPSGTLVRAGRIFNIRGAGEIYSIHGAQ